MCVLCVCVCECEVDGINNKRLVLYNSRIVLWWGQLVLICTERSLVQHREEIFLPCWTSYPFGYKFYIHHQIIMDVDNFASYGLTDNRQR